MALATFVYFSVLPYFWHVPVGFLVAFLHVVHNLSIYKDARKKNCGKFPFWGFICDFVILNFTDFG